MGIRCTLKKTNDRAFDYEARDFIGAECELVKRCDSGLVVIALKSSSDRVVTVPSDDIEMLNGSD